MTPYKLNDDLGEKKTVFFTLAPNWQVVDTLIRNLIQSAPFKITVFCADRTSAAHCRLSHLSYVLSSHSKDEICHALQSRGYVPHFLEPDCAFVHGVVFNNIEGTVDDKISRLESSGWRAKGRWIMNWWCVNMCEFIPRICANHKIGASMSSLVFAL